MRTCVTFEKATYVINEKKGTVACILRGSIDPVKRKKGANAYYELINRGAHSKELSKFINEWGEFKVIGIAKCSPLDSFDAGIGTKISESRAKKQAFNLIKRVCLVAEKDMLARMNNIMSIRMACTIAEQKEVAHLANVKSEIV